VAKAKLRTYKGGEQINIAVTKDFAPIATEFFRYCLEKGYNPSEIIRMLIASWLKQKKELDELEKKVLSGELVLTRKEMLSNLMKMYEKSVLFEEED